MSDLTERLRDADTAYRVTRHGKPSLWGEAADRIEEMEADRLKLISVLDEMVDTFDLMYFVEDHGLRWSDPTGWTWDGTP